MKYFLCIYLTESSLPDFQDLEKSSYIIGRHNSCDIQLVNKFLSRHHATLILHPPDKKNDSYYYTLRDGVLRGNKSSNGVWVNSKRIDNSIRLRHKDVITFGVPCGYPEIIFLLERADELNKEEGTFPNEYGTDIQ
ncbi:FHA domain-containing protein [Nostoc sp.]|uniref:FHA domain-containing protein n=1 Tax=Nostoc sp. TaxID=1180 RepID=UPI002FF9C454